MRNEVQYIYMMKLSDYEVRAMIAILNDQRLKLKARGEDTGAINDLILRFLDVRDYIAA